MNVQNQFSVVCSQDTDGVQIYHLRVDQQSWEAPLKAWLNSEFAVKCLMKHYEAIIRQAVKYVHVYHKKANYYWRYYDKYSQGCERRPIYDDEGNFLYYRRQFRRRRGKRNGSRK